MDPIRLDDDVKERVRAAARIYLRDDLPQLEAAGVLPDPGRDSPWIDRERLWRRRGRVAAATLAEVLKAVPGRWNGPLAYPDPDEYVEALLRGVIAAATVESYRYGEATQGPGAQIEELLDHLEHPEQPIRLLRLLADVDVTAVEGQTVHGLRVRDVRRLAETLALELPEAAKEVMETHVSLGSREPRALVIGDRTGHDGWAVALKLRPHLVHVATALRLATGGTILELAEAYGQPKMVHVAGPIAFRIDPEHASYWRRIGVIGPQQLAATEAIATQICDLDVVSETKAPATIAVAIGRFSRSHRAAGWPDLVIDLAIGLEAALSTGEKEEITLRVRTRAAHLLARPDDPPEAIFSDVGDLLSLRGTVAHGDVVPPKRWRDLFKSRGLDQAMESDRVSILFDRWRDLLRRAIVARLLLDDGGSGPWLLRQLPQDSVDATLIAAAGRHQWRRTMRRRAVELGFPALLDRPAPLRDFLHDHYSDDLNH